MVGELQPFGQRPAAGGKGIDSPGSLGIDDKRRGVLRLQAGVDHQRPSAAPVLLLDKLTHAVEICCRVGPRERDPQKIGDGPGDEVAVIDEDEEGKAGEDGLMGSGFAELTDYRQV